MEFVAAAVQFAPLPGEHRRNLNVGVQLAFEASLAGASLIVLPELCVTGPDVMSLREAAAGSQPSCGWQTRAVQALAELTGVHVVFGYIESAGECFFNSAALVGPKGLVRNFRKRNLWGPDYFWATPSDEVTGEVAVTPMGRVGALVCRDVQNHPRKSAPEPCRPYYERGAVDIVCVPTSWDTFDQFPVSSWVELAEELSCHVVVSNRAPVAGESHVGGPCIIDRSLRVWSDGAGRTAECVVGARLGVQ